MGSWQHKTIPTFVVLICFFGTLQGYLLPIEPRGPLSGKDWPPGSPWPLPFSWTSTGNLVTFDASSFQIIKNFSYSCEPIDFSIGKYNSSFLFPTYGSLPTTPDPKYPVATKLVISLTGAEQEAECKKYPSLSEEPGLTEQYDLEIKIENGTAIATITAQTVWGALHGIETFSQLLWSNDDTVTPESIMFYANSTNIHDKPRFSHRGLMIDSARHYLPERIFYEVLDGMKYNKLSVLHWHIVDDQSFPFVSRAYPELSKKGALNDKAIYSPEMVQRVITAARLRGIRVILEFDTPGHTHGFAKAYPELLTPCYGNGPSGDPEAPNYPEHAGRENLDPTKEFTYEFMKNFFTELAENVTKDAFIHIGMDEVYPPCWERSHNPVIDEFMKANSYNSVHQVQGHYGKRHTAMVESLKLNPIAWQDPLDIGIDLDKSVVIQLWKDWGNPWPTQLKQTIQKGYRAILSSPWYINYIEYGETWTKYYKQDPFKSGSGLTESEKKRVLGGEACIWSEYVDKTNIMPRIFPYVSAIGERLWTFDMGIDDKAAFDARGRLDQHRCRMLRRGLTVQPILNGYCGRWETENRRRR